MGDCVNEVDVVLDSENVLDFYSTYEVVSCDDPHQAEVIGVLSLTLPAYDEGDIVVDLDDRCRDVFVAYVGVDPEQSSYNYFAAYPTEAQWEAGDRSGACMVLDLQGLITGSIAGTAL